MTSEGVDCTVASARTLDHLILVIPNSDLQNDFGDHVEVWYWARMTVERQSPVSVVVVVVPEVKTRGRTPRYGSEPQRVQRD
jgi:hypothetical protein